MANIKRLITKMSIVTLPQSALLKEVVKLLDEREAFTHTDPDLNERIFDSSVFEAISSEMAEYEDGHMFKASQEVINQLDEVAELVGDADYVLITNFSI